MFVHGPRRRRDVVRRECALSRGHVAHQQSAKGRRARHGDDYIGPVPERLHVTELALVNGGDARWTGRFDAVVNLFTSFGFFTDAKDDALTIREFARVLEPGARWCGTEEAATA